MIRFYPIRYYSKKFRDSMKEANRFDYTKSTIVRRAIGWGRIPIIGQYAEYIRYENERIPLHRVKKKKETLPRLKRTHF